MFALINTPAANSDPIPKLATHWLTDPTTITIEFLPNVSLIALVAASTDFVALP